MSQDDFVYFLGCIFAVYLLFKILISIYRIIYVHFLAARFGHVANLTKYGKWAVVTGSTDGIGKGYALELAKRGLNLILIARNETKLETTVNEIRANCGNSSEIKTITFDFTDTSITSYQKIKTVLSDYNVGILVNNVGVSSECPDYFLSYPGGDKFWKTVIDVNCFSVVEMTYSVLPDMIKRKKGLIINISSASAFCPVALLSVYSGTKTFIDFFTCGLMEEYRDSGVEFQCVYPALVATNMSKVRANFFAPNPEQFAREALNTVGLERKTVGCLSHVIQVRHVALA